MSGSRGSRCRLISLHIITRCLGDVDAVCEPDVLVYKIIPGDILLSCSDGLCGYCTNLSIEKIMFNSYERLDYCCDKLLELALNAGGHDNITVALMATLPNNLHEPIVTNIIKLKRFLNKLF